ncbi:CmpA/NrtA family ABC transporter substrate-binding protein [Salinisphaera sp. SPP-AMP-43]|uniref:CmpA/NrtA family ABC transporter substrate-binding protein n=1 Tax=Salinisphaera sp. SPP-AMP-43 TaxID=3121288 RepID=UPI003C6E1352
MDNRADQSTIEKPRLKLGFIALADCVPLVAARELGFFAEQGLDVRLERQGSWAAIRDNVAIGRLDGAQMLAGLPLAATLGYGMPPTPMVTALSLGANGNSICLSNEVWQRMRAIDPGVIDARPARADALRTVIAEDRAAGLAPLTFAMVHPVSSHNYQLRYWLAAAGIDPDRDVRLIVVPPARMLANLRAHRIAGYCVGAPWSEHAVAEGLGHVPATGYEIWNNAPEKVLGVARDWAEAYPKTHRALIRALIRACDWLDEPDNRERIAAFVAQSEYVDCDPERLAAVYDGRIARHPDGPVEDHPDHLVFSRYHSGFPWRSHALWFVRQMQRWGQLHPATDAVEVAEAVYRPDIYREVCVELGRSAPAADYKIEGEHARCWSDAAAFGQGITLGPDRFFDGGRFDPEVAAPVAHSRPQSVLNAVQGDLS